MWTTEDDVVARLRKRWDSGRWLAALTRGADFEPVMVTLTAPKPAELERSFGEVQEWARRWKSVPPERLRVEYKRIGGRRIGANEVPCRVWVDTFEQLCSLLHTRSAVDRFRRLLTAITDTDPRLCEWVAGHPMRALELVEDWPRLLAAVRWIRDCTEPGRLYLRQVDAPAVDTKFIESHRGTLAGLLDLVVPPERIDTGQPVTSFAARYGFRTKPKYVRFRLLGGTTPGGYTELSVRAEEFHAPGDVETVFIVENETTFLAFPEHPRSMVILGGGYAVDTAARIDGLADRRVLYWGDLDTHGFAILNRLRAHLPRAASLLMDTDTLLSHEAHWAREPDPTDAALERLTAHESDLYLGLTTDRWAPSLRLEQERIRFSHLAEALEGLRANEPARRR
ncbi:Wadjet anti-phage system protein JetD domain-containing protein [Nocardiopsis chromatogenes]|uniref:Wadjet anti-phage system protein JetD domain-containing protein n=1 Tax=Nocardiopsis chromatogenes TaxID=280239 RepID=UPI0003800D39|nr:Wadjet anti-phage system protein JetD domain-containing protein [Nocardiopsis chromatogenes]